MVMIPELKTAFCGSSLRTGTKVIGWVTMSLGILQFLMFAIAIGLLAATVSNTDDERMGKQAIEMLQDLDNLDDPLINQDGATKDEIQGATALHGLLVLLIGNKDTSDPAVLGNQLKNQLQGVFTVIFLAVLFFVSVHTLFCVLLLIGAHKNKSGYILFFLVPAVFGLFCYFPVLFNNYATFNVVISMLIGFLIHVYFTWVIYSFYKELQRQNYSAKNMPVIVMPGQKLHLEGQEPFLVTSDNVNNYYYPQK